MNTPGPEDHVRAVARKVTSAGASSPPGTEILYLSAEETRHLLDAPTAMHLVEETLRWQAEGQVLYSDPAALTLTMQEPHSAYRLKGCYLSALGIAGFRVTGFRLDVPGKGSGAPDNTRFVILSDPATGRPQAILDEHWTYSVRTVGAAAVAAKYLARSDSHVLGLLGAGNLAAAALPLLEALFPLTHVRVASRRLESRASFVAAARTRARATLEPVDSLRDAVQGADLVVTATSANARLVEAEWLERGVFVCALGRYELADGVFQSADKVVMDSWELSQESPDVQALVTRGVLSRATLYAELADIVVGRRPGRERPTERTVARIEGLASQDVAIAAWVVEQARQRGIGTHLLAGG